MPNKIISKSFSYAVSFRYYGSCLQVFFHNTCTCFTGMSNRDTKHENSVSVAFLLFTTELRKQHDNHPHQMFILDKEHEVLIMF